MNAVTIADMVPHGMVGDITGMPNRRKAGGFGVRADDVKANRGRINLYTPAYVATWAALTMRAAGPCPKSSDL